MDFEKHGFKTGKVVLPGINLEVNLPNNAYFRNDGIVEDIRKHTFDVLYDINPSLQIYDNSNLVSGKCLTISTYTNKETLKGSVTYIRDNGEGNNLFLYGHESTHAVMHLGLEEQFLCMLRREGFMLNPFTKFKDDELIAHVGGFIALNKYYVVENLQNPELSYAYKELLSSRK